MGSLCLHLFACQSNYNGPETKNFRSGYFVNTEQEEVSLLDLIKLWWGLNSDWPDSIPSPTKELVAKRVTEGIRYTFLTHSTFLVQTAGQNILTDPVYSERVSPVSFAGPKRVRAPGINFEDLPDIDVVVISHDHYDHFDSETITRLQTHNKSGPPPMFLVGLGVGAHLDKLGVKRYRELNWNQFHKHKGLDYWFVECKHRSGRGVFDQMTTLWGSFVIQSPAGRIYFAGDTGYSNHFLRQRKDFKDFRLALIPIGAYEPRWFMKRVHLNPDEAIQAHKDLRSEHSVGKHFGTFQLTYEGIDEPAQRIATLKAEQNIHNFFVPIFGESTLLSAQDNFEVIAPLFGHDDPKKHLEASEVYDYDNKALQKLVAARSVPDDPKATAVALHNFVRDEIKFRFSEDFEDLKASMVLAKGEGFSHEKSALLIALLRAAKIPARLRITQLRADLLYPNMDFDENEGMEHSLVEAYVDDKWQSFDTHLIPLDDYKRLSQKRQNRELNCFSGVCEGSETAWQGLGDQYTQWLETTKGPERPYYKDFISYLDYFNRGDLTSLTKQKLWQLKAKKRSELYRQNSKWR